MFIMLVGMMVSEPFKQWMVDSTGGFLGGASTTVGAWFISIMNFGALNGTNAAMIFMSLVGLGLLFALLLKRMWNRMPGFLQTKPKQQVVYQNTLSGSSPVTIQPPQPQPQPQPVTENNQKTS